MIISILALPAVVKIPRIFFALQNVSKEATDDLRGRVAKAINH